jgi:streptogramin lyase
VSKKASFIFILFIILAGTFTMPVYTTVNTTYKHSERFLEFGELGFIDLDGYVIPQLENVTYLLSEGRPIVPVRTLVFKLGSDYELFDVKVDLTVNELPGSYRLAPAPEPRPLFSGEPLLVGEPDPSVYSQFTPYPTEWYKYKVVNGIDPVTLKRIGYLVLTIYPIRYIPAEGKLLFAREVEVSVEYEGVEALGLAQPKLLIITDPSFLQQANQLASYKSSSGITSTVVTTTWIYDNYQGVDEPEKIRNCIKEYVEVEGVNFVLIFGDAERVPVRYAWIPDGYADDDEVEDGSYVETDLYYADLDFDWDENGDGKWGDVAGGDMVEGVPDVYVGRLPVSSVDEAEAIVSKIMEYRAEGSWFGRFLLIGTATFGNYEGEILKDYIQQNFIWNNYTYTKLYESYGNLSSSRIFSEIDAGYGFVNYAGHGEITNWNLGLDLYTDTDASLQSNGNRLPMIFSMACLTSRFAGIDGIGEKFLINPNGGAIAYFGSTRVAWGYIGATITSGLAGEMDWRFIQSYFNAQDDGTPKRPYVGLIWGDAVTNYVFAHGISSVYDWKTVAEYGTVFGDPSLLLEPRLVRLSGYVLDGEGNPVENAYVEAIGAMGFSYQTYTDVAGYYELILKAGEFYLKASHDGFLDYRSGRLSLTYDTEFNITLTKPFQTEVLLVVDDDVTYPVVWPEEIAAVLGNHLVWRESIRGLPPLSALQSADVVIWHTGESSGGVIDDVDAGTIKEFLDSGGNLMVEGANVASEHLDDSFLESVVNASFTAKVYNAAVLTLGNTEHRILEGLNGPIELSSPCDPDGVAPVGEAEALMFYNGTSLAALITYDRTDEGLGRAVYLSFPLHYLSSENRAVILANSISWLKEKFFFITSDDEFNPRHWVLGGSGTEGDPYLIGGFSVTAETINPAVQGNFGFLIANTTKHFIIKETEIRGGNYGIVLLNVTNGKVRDALLTDNDVGLYVRDSDNIIVESVNVLSNETGLLCEASNLWVINSTIANGLNGAVFLEGSNVRVLSSELVNNVVGVRTINSVLALYGNDVSGSSIGIQVDEASTVYAYLNNLFDNEVDLDGGAYAKWNWWGREEGPISPNDDLSPWLRSEIALSRSAFGREGTMLNYVEDLGIALVFNGEFEVVVAKHDANPGTPYPLPLSHFVDVYVSRATEAEVRIYGDVDSYTKVMFWDGELWREVSDYAVYPREGYASVWLSSQTEPSILGVAVLALVDSKVDLFHEFYPLITAYAIQENLVSIAAARDGSLWLGANGKLIRWKSGDIRSIDIPVTPEHIAVYRDEVWFSFNDTLWCYGSEGLLNVNVGHKITDIGVYRGKVWFSSDGGIGYYDDSLYFIPLNGTISSMAVDRRGNVWFASPDDHRIGRYNIREGTFEFFELAGRPEKLVIDGKGIWISAPSDGKVFYYELRSRSFTDFQVGDVLDIGAGASGVWLALPNKIGVISRGVFTNFPIKVGEKVIVDRRGNAWYIGEEGLKKVESRNGYLEVISLSPALELKELDGSADLWALSQGGLLMHLNLREDYGEMVKRVGPDAGLRIGKRGEVWMYSGGKVLQFDPDSGKFTEFEVSEYDIVDMDIDRYGKLWFATNSSIGYLYLGRHGIERGEFAIIGVKKLEVDSRGDVWYMKGGTDVIGRLEVRSGETTEINVGVEPSCMAVDRRGNVWFASNGGIWKATLDGDVEFLMNIGETVKNMVFSRRGGLWILLEGKVLLLKTRDLSTVTYQLQIGDARSIHTVRKGGLLILENNILILHMRGRMPDF